MLDKPPLYSMRIPLSHEIDYWSVKFSIKDQSCGNALGCFEAAVGAIVDEETKELRREIERLREIERAANALLDTDTEDPVADCAAFLDLAAAVGRLPLERATMEAST